MTDEERTDADDFIDEPGPGADPGEAYRRAANEGQLAPDDEDADAPNRPDVGDVYRSGS